MGVLKDIIFMLKSANIIPKILCIMKISYKVWRENMLIQSKRVWIADQFISAQIEIDDNKIINNKKRASQV